MVYVWDLYNKNCAHSGQQYTSGVRLWQRPRAIAAASALSCCGLPGQWWCNIQYIYWSVAAPFSSISVCFVLLQRYIISADFDTALTFIEWLLSEMWLFVVGRWNCDCDAHRGCRYLAHVNTSVLPVLKQLSLLKNPLPEPSFYFSSWKQHKLPIYCYRAIYLE